MHAIFAVITILTSLFLGGYDSPTTLDGVSAPTSSQASVEEDRGPGPDPWG